MNDKVKRATAAVEEARTAHKTAEQRMQEAVDAIDAAADDISPDDLAALNGAFDEAEQDVARCKADVAKAESDLAREERIVQARTTRPVAADVKVVDEEAVYRRDSDASWFKDMFAAKHGDSDAIQRLHKNNKQVRDAVKAKGEQRANASGGGFLPPIYLGDQWAKIPHPSRPFVNSLPKLDLPPDGMTFTIPVVSGATSVGVHADGGNVSDTAAATTTVSHTLVAIAGQNEIDRVVLERSFPGLDMVIFDDLRRLYDTQMGVQSFTGSGSSGNHLGLDNVSGILTATYTDASPTGLKLLQQGIYPAISKIYSARYLPPTAIVMHPRRAAWLASTSDSTYPLFNQGGLGTFQLGEQDNGVVGMIAGLPVIADANIATNKGASTNQDTIYVVRLDDFLFGEEGVQSATFEEVVSSTLAIRLQLWGYSLMALDRYPSAICAINGTGLAQPTNF